MNLFGYKHRWNLLRYSYKDKSDRIGDFVASDVPLFLELNISDRKTVSLWKGKDVMESFYLCEDTWPLQVGILGDSMAFLFASQNLQYSKKQLRIRFNSVDDCMACRTIFDKIGVEFLPEPSSSQRTVAASSQLECSQYSQGGNGRPVNYYGNVPPAFGAESLPQPTNDSEYALQEKIRSLFRNPSFPEFVVKVEKVLNDLNAFPSSR